MTADKPHKQWSELNDMTVIEAMLKGTNSEYWEKCSKFVRYYIEKNFSNLPEHLRDDTVQETMLSVHRGLSTFRRQCKFTTWLTYIARNRAVDGHRRHADIRQSEIHSDNLPESREDGTERSTTPVPRTPEQLALTHEQIREVLALIEVFLQMHPKPERNRQILRMVLFDGHSYEETAQKLGVPAPVIGYVVRSVRIYLRQQLSLSPESDE